MSEEKALGDEIKRLPEVTSLQSYASTVGLTVPSDMIPPEKLALLNSEKYTRLVISARVPPESEETFAFVERLRSLGEAYYPGTYLLAGEATSVYDLKKTILSDAKMVNILSIGGIALILFLTFRSVGLPIILLITIESAIFINVSIPYFMDTPLHYIVYLIISSVQLGATVDYAILFTDRYRENRCRLSRKKAARQTVEDCASSILTSAAILFASGLILSLTSSNLVIGQLGMLLARGTLLSFVFVFALLPALLVKFESLIPKISLQLKSGILEQEEDTPYDTQS
jgi:predicted RND superfamily exporter protein